MVIRLITRIAMAFGVGRNTMPTVMRLTARTEMVQSEEHQLTNVTGGYLVTVVHPK